MLKKDKAKLKTALAKVFGWNNKMLSKSKLKTWLKRKGFKPKNANTRNFLKWGIVSRNCRYFRIRSNEHEFEGGSKRWTVDVSCVIEDFDRWANSCDEHAVDLETFMKRY